MKRRELVLAALSAGGVAAAPWARAQSAFPNRPIKLVVPWAAGGSTDIVCRAMAEEARTVLGQPVIVENRPGGSSAVGMTVVKNAAPDGYTIGQAPGAMFRVALMESVAFDPLADFTYLMGAAIQTLGIVVRADAPYRSFKDILEAARRDPGKLNFGSTGMASGNRLYTEDLLRRAGVLIEHIPYNGSAALHTALLAKEVDFGVDSGSFAPLVEARKLRLLATFTPQRLRTFADVPTLRELGFDITIGSQYGFVAPKGLAPAVAKTLHDALRYAWQQSRVQARFFVFHEMPNYLSPADYRRQAPELMARERVVIERAGLLRRA
jgi:tripartite-type tricarboxylate transporter receptor subunit TctC